MKIRHGDLETCRTDSRAWLKNAIAGKSRPSMSYERIAVMSIYRFHKTGDLNDAVSYLPYLASKYRLNNPTRLEDLDEKLRSYGAWIETSQPIVVKHKINIRLPLTDKTFLAGEVSRLDIDLKSGGYRCVLVTDKEIDWRSQLRMPLLQLAIATSFGREVSDVAVGLQRIDGSGLSVTSFTEIRVREASDEARQIAATIDSMVSQT